MVEKDLREVNKIIDELNTKYKGSSIIRGAGDLKIDKISTGLVSVDKLFGGGIPKRRWTMMYGQKGAGKTSLNYKIIGLIQEAGGKAVYVDAEHAFDPNYAKEMGVDLDSLIFCSPTTLEESETIVQKFAPVVDLIVVDSIVAVASEQESERELEKDTMALGARKLSQFFRVVTPIVGKSNAAVILVNQTRMDLGAYVPIDRYPGGHALAHYCSFIMKMRRSSYKDFPMGEVEGPDGKKKEEAIGIRIVLHAEKSKISNTEGKETCFDLLKEFPHFDEYTDLLLAAEMEGYIVHQGAWFQTVLTGEEKFQGRDSVLKALREKEKLFEGLKAKVLGIEKSEAKNEKKTGKD